MQGTYDPYLVLLSVLTAIAASYSALELAGRVSSTGSRAARLWLPGGALAMGFGIWSMHFVGMLAFSLPITLAYDTLLTAASLAIAVITSGFALSVVARLAVADRQQVDMPILAAGGVLMGSGICGMHYTGMGALKMSPPILYTPLLFAASLALAVLASIAALWLSFALLSASSMRRLVLRALAAIVMGLAISGMHYTGMAAARFSPGAICTVSGATVLTNKELGYALGASVIAILWLTLTLSRAESRRAAMP